MARSAVGFKDEASANEIQRWLSRQQSMGRSVTRHHETLTTAGATVRGLGVVEPARVTNAPRVTFAATPTGTPTAGASKPNYPNSKEATTAPKPEISARPNSSNRIPPTHACNAARARMGVDLTTGKPNTAMYGGLAGFRSANTETYGAAHDPKSRELLKPALAIANPKPAESQTRSRYAESLRGDAAHETWWRVNCLRSTKVVFDEPVALAAAQRPGAADDLATGRRNFVAAALGNRLYYGDLLDETGVANLDKALRTLPVEQADQMITTLRELHAGTAEARRRTKRATTAPKPEISARPNSSNRIPPTHACNAARARMGVDLTTGKPNTAMYGGLAGFRSANTETYGAAHDPKSRELLKPALAIANPKPAESQTRSRYAESLRGDAAHETWWRVNCLRSTKVVFDEPVALAAAQRPGAADDLATGRRNFVAAALGNRLYYGDLLDETGVANLDKALRTLPVEQADQMITTLRELHAGTAEARRRTKSASAAAYNQGYVPTVRDTARRAETAGRITRQKGGVGENAEVVQARAKRKLAMAQAETLAVTEAKQSLARRKRDGKAAFAIGVSCDPGKKRKTRGPTYGELKSLGGETESAEVPRFASSYQTKQCAYISEIVAQNRAGGGHRVKHVELSTAPFGEGAGVGRKHETDDDVSGDAVIGISRNKNSSSFVEGKRNARTGGQRGLYAIPAYLTKRTLDREHGKFCQSTTSRRAFAPASTVRNFPTERAPPSRYYLQRW